MAGSLLLSALVTIFAVKESGITPALPGQEGKMFEAVQVSPRIDS
jgi:hypothetical protein